MPHHAKNGEARRRGQREGGDWAIRRGVIILITRRYAKAGTAFRTIKIRASRVPEASESKGRQT